MMKLETTIIVIIGVELWKPRGTLQDCTSNVKGVTLQWRVWDRMMISQRGVSESVKMPSHCTGKGLQYFPACVGLEPTKNTLFEGGIQPT